MRRFGLLVFAAALWSAGGCRSSDTRQSGQSAQVVDSFVPPEQALQEFRVNLPPVTELQGGKATRDSLVSAYFRALIERDTAALASMAVTRSEFGYLYYPTSPQSRPPYELAPELMWHLLVSRSDLGVRRALQKYGGASVRFSGYECDTTASREGENTVWGPCHVRLRTADGKTYSVRLFSQILGRSGRYKFLSYANKL